MIKFRLGNSLKGNLPAQGNFRMFRAGQRHLSSYEYDTLPLNEINPNFPESEHYEVDEIDRLFSRAGFGDASPWSDRQSFEETDPRMTTGADMFAIMDNGDTSFWWRYPTNALAGGVSYIRNKGQDEEKNETVGMVFRAHKTIESGITGYTWDEASSLTWREGGAYSWNGTRMDESSTYVYFDNAQVKLSNILWEFSGDGGDDKWYQLYDLPNRAYTRVNLPNSTNSLKVRAISNNLEEWVQGIVLTPKPDKQDVPNKHDIATAPISITDITIDEFGNLSWSIEGGNPNINVYEIIIEAESGMRTLTTKDTYINCGDTSDIKNISVRAHGIGAGAEGSISLIKIYPANDLYPSESLYPRV